METKLLELYDLASGQGVDPVEFERAMQDYVGEYEQLDDFLNNNPEFQELGQMMMDELAGKPIDTEILNLMRENFDLPGKIEVKATPVYTPPPTPKVETSNVQPAPTPEIIEEAPYHQGPSPM